MAPPNSAQPSQGDSPGDKPKQPGLTWLKPLPPRAAATPKHVPPKPGAPAAKPAAPPAAAKQPAKAPAPKAAPAPAPKPPPAPSKPRVLVTGAAGFIASHLIPHLLETDHAVGAMVRFSTKASDSSKRRVQALEKLQSKYKDRLQLVRCEDGNSLPEAVQRVKPEICIHLAGRSWVRESVAWPEQYVDANYRTTIALLDALHGAGCRRIVFASSTMVYGKDAPLPYMEDSLGSAPASPYGASKLSCEVLLNMYHLLHNMETVNLRLFAVYGPDLRQDCVPHLVATAIMKSKPFTVFGDGTSMRDYIEIRDVLSALDAACLGHDSHAALNVGSGFGTTLLELIALLEKFLEKKAELVFKPPVPGELLLAVPDISLAMEKLNWEPKISVEEGTARMAEWFKNPENLLNGNSGSSGKFSRPI